MSSISSFRPLQPTEDDGGADVHCVASGEPQARANGNVLYCNRSYRIVCPTLSYGERPPPFEVKKHCNEISPQPSVLQSEQLQLSQIFLTGEVLQPSDNFYGSSLDPLQLVLVLLVRRTPELDTIL